MDRQSRRGRSIVAAAFVIFVSIFVVMTTTQLASGVFGKRSAERSEHLPPPACVAGISKLVPALDRALAAASASSDETASLAAFSSAALPEWNDREKIEADCAKTPDGEEAFAALLRLRRAQESLLRRQAAELSPMRQDVDAYLR